MDKKVGRSDLGTLVARFKRATRHECFQEAQKYIDKHPGRYKIYSGSVERSTPGQIFFFSEVYRD